MKYGDGWLSPDEIRRIEARRAANESLRKWFADNPAPFQQKAAQPMTIKKFLTQSWKALAAGLAAGAVAFQSGQNLSLSIAAGVGAAVTVWFVPNAGAA